MTYEESRALFVRLFKNEMSEDEARQFLKIPYVQGEGEEEIAAAALTMREFSKKLPIPDELAKQAIDIVGTGGDKSGSFNISSTVSLLLASCGSYVAKHGNRSITSKSGSADMLEALGVRIDLSPENSAVLLQECGFCYLFAQNYHPAMKHIMPIRKSLPDRTVFNLLGPLTNPAGVTKHLIGVYSPEYCEVLASVLMRLGSKSGFVVSSQSGIDELTLHESTVVVEFSKKGLKKSEFDFKELGFKSAPMEQLLGGEGAENAKITYAILTGELDGPKFDAVLLNAAFALVADGKTDELKEGVKIAKEAIKSKKAAATLKKIIEVSNKL